MKDIYVIDASGFLYRSYFAIRNITNDKGESTNALFGYIRSVLKLIKDFSPTHLVSVFDGPQGIKKRAALYADYKAHRAKMPPDLRYQIDWAHNFCDLIGIPQLSIPEVEADDTMGSIAKWAEQHHSNVYLCTSDKDFAQLVSNKVKILNTHKENLLIGPEQVMEIYGVPPEKIIDWLSITGDASDNVPGLSGFGPKTAADLLNKLGSLEHIVKHPEQVSGQKKQETIVKEADQVLLSKQLVTIDTFVDVPQDPEFYRIKTPNLPELQKFYSYMNFNTLLKELGDTPTIKEDKEEVSYVLVDDEASFQELLTFLSQQKEICFDTETTNIRPMLAELVGISFGIEPKKAWYVPTNGKLGEKRVLEGLKPLFENPEIDFYGHNVKYDWHVLANHGINLKSISFDTIIASYLLNSHSRQHSLDTLALTLFGKVKIPISDLIGKGKKEISMRDVPIEKVCYYACEDVDYTCRLKLEFEKQLEERNLMKLFRELELPLVLVLAKMERHGVFIDVPNLSAFSKEIRSQISILEENIFKLAGETFNLNSPKQLSEILFTKLDIRPPKRTATGFSTNVEVLEFLKDKYPICASIIEYRALEKLRSTYVDTLPLEVNPITQRIHPNFMQSVTTTGRLSCQDPNLQNIPIRSTTGIRIREAFRSEKEGWSYLGADYSQIELRLLAHFSEDPTLIQAFQAGEDIHMHTAATVLGIPINEVTKEQRFHAKAINFGIIYGQQAFGLSQELGIPLDQAAAFINAYFNRYRKVREFLESSKEKARKSGKAVTLLGRERQIPEINSKNGMIRSAAERLATNTPLQGTAADMIKMAMLEINRRLESENTQAFMILQVHDELIFEVPQAEEEKVKKIVKESMENVFKLAVPLVVDIAIGKNWKEC